MNLLRNFFSVLIMFVWLIFGLILLAGALVWFLNQQLIQLGLSFIPENIVFAFLNPFHTISPIVNYLPHLLMIFGLFLIYLAVQMGRRRAWTWQASRLILLFLAIYVPSFVLSTEALYQQIVALGYTNQPIGWLPSALVTLYGDELFTQRFLLAVAGVATVLLFASFLIDWSYVAPKNEDVLKQMYRQDLCLETGELRLPKPSDSGDPNAQQQTYCDKVDNVRYLNLRLKFQGVITDQVIRDILLRFSPHPNDREKRVGTNPISDGVILPLAHPDLASVGSTHVSFTFEQEQIRAYDLHIGQTLVNDKPIQKEYGQIINHGDRIQLGQAVFTIQLEAADRLVTRQETA